ncbi:hypothetical protein LS66_007025 [Helicobacter sp. MIT 03-1614]|jgi:hypothetical protein|uniref:TerC family integral membrane protein n=1 Tax=Helicobacter hepaticus (strain ATCC 51449 / 3B1) TaxID=235279 RepID=Q7VHH2_HELHP|nr:MULTISPECIES: hypothetical protein [Helicobacter]AAP77592.1 conserved hypothetical protein [Helicobacter hepaticus ATCC 51449]TLD88049.1 hypothetical protein LS66_007025 [Helicobacter sp. MIT 03-1614]
MQEFDSLILHDTFMDLVLYHKIFAGFFALPFVLNLLVLFFGSKNLVAMNKKIWFIAPIIFFLLSVSVLSGINIWIFGNLELSLKIIAMITFCIFVLIGEIYRIKILKVARRTNLEAMKGYVKFCKILYIMDLLFFILLFWLA